MTKFDTLYNKLINEEVGYKYQDLYHQMQNIVKEVLEKGINPQTVETIAKFAVQSGDEMGIMLLSNLKQKLNSSEQNNLYTQLIEGMYDKDIKNEFVNNFLPKIRSVLVKKSFE